VRACASGPKILGIVTRMKERRKGAGRICVYTWSRHCCSGAAL